MNSISINRQYLCQVNAIINTNMEKGMQNYKQDDYDGVTHTWDIIQREVCSLSSVIDDR